MGAVGGGGIGGCRGRGIIVVGVLLRWMRRSTARITCSITIGSRAITIATAAAIR